MPHLKTEIKKVEKDQSEDNNGDVYKIVKLQALIRGFLVRRQFERLKKENISIQNGDHFIKEEYQETISKNEVYDKRLTP